MVTGPPVPPSEPEPDAPPSPVVWAAWPESPLPPLSSSSSPQAAAPSASSTATASTVSRRKSDIASSSSVGRISQPRLRSLEQDRPEDDRSLDHLLDLGREVHLRHQAEDEREREHPEEG